MTAGGRQRWQCQGDSGQPAALAVGRCSVVCRASQVQAWQVQGKGMSGAGVGGRGPGQAPGWYDAGAGGHAQGIRSCRNPCHRIPMPILSADNADRSGDLVKEMLDGLGPLPDLPRDADGLAALLHGKGWPQWIGSPCSASVPSPFCLQIPMDARLPLPQDLSICCAASSLLLSALPHSLHSSHLPACRPLAHQSSSTSISHADVEAASKLEADGGAQASARAACRGSIVQQVHFKRPPQPWQGGHSNNRHADAVRRHAGRLGQPLRL